MKAGKKLFMPQWHSSDRRGVDLTDYHRGGGGRSVSCMSSLFSRTGPSLGLRESNTPGMLHGVYMKAEGLERNATAFRRGE